jgi:hypothetical protein
LRSWVGGTTSIRALKALFTDSGVGAVADRLGVKIDLLVAARPDPTFWRAGASMGV